MKELLRTNDPVLISYTEDLLSQADIRHLLTDQNASIIEGSIGALQKRILVSDDDFNAARRIMREAGIGDEISRTHNRD